MAAPDALGAAYRRRVLAIRSAVQARLEALYGRTIDFEDIKGSFAEYIGGAEPVIAAGQASVASLAAAYLESRAARAGVDLALDVVDDAIGTTRAGEDLATGMAAFGAMALGQVALGRSAGEVLDYGRFLATNFADAELTGTIDRIEQAPEVRERLTGWRGTVSAGACDRCQENAGDHDPGWEPYRHGNCDCVVEPIFGQ